MLINYDNDNDDHGHNTGQLLTYILTNIANMSFWNYLTANWPLYFWEWVDNQTYILCFWSKVFKTLAQIDKSWFSQMT